MLEQYKRKQSIFDSSLKLSKWETIAKWKIEKGNPFTNRVSTRCERERDGKGESYKTKSCSCLNERHLLSKINSETGADAGCHLI